MNAPLQTNKNIFIFWHQGFSNAPAIVQSCRNSWSLAVQGSGWNIHAISAENLGYYLEGMPANERLALEWFQARLRPNNEHFSWTKFTDILRVCLVANFGGLWVDSTVLAIQPIQNWTAFENRSLCMPRAASSFEKVTEMWLLYGLKDSVVLKEWKEELITQLCFRELRPAQNWNFKSRNLDYWLKRIATISPRTTLLWFHPIVQKFVRKSPYFAAYYCFNKVLSNHGQLSKPYLYTMAFDSDAWVEFNRSDWELEVAPQLRQRLFSQDFIKLDWKRLQSDQIDTWTDGVLIDILKFSENQLGKS